MNKDFAKGLIAGLVLTFIFSTFMIWMMLHDKKLNSTAGKSDVDAKLQQLQFYIDTYYIGDVDKEKLKNSAYIGYVSGLGDKYSEYYTPPENEKVQEHYAGSFVGIGVYVGIDQEEGLPKIVQLIDGGTAKEAGVESGDFILAVDGKNTEGLTLDDVTDMIRGEEGTELVLLVRREGAPDNIEITVKRAKVENITVSKSMLDNNIGYIFVSSFESTTINQFKDAVDSLTDEGAEALILDFRGNGGGLYSSAVSMLDRLLPANELVAYTIDKKGKREDSKTVDSDEVNLPMAVLINGNSASASEVFAGCLRDKKKAVMVGETSYGKGIMQTLFGLPAGDSLKLTTAYYYLPGGDNIHEKGINPDIPVTDDPDTENDEVIEAAVDYLLNK